MTKFSTETKIQIFRIIFQDSTLTDFEQWIYENRELEELLSPDDHLELISIRYQNEGAVYLAGAILERYINWAEYDDWELRHLLTKIINRTPDFIEAFVEIYILYSSYDFLDHLALSYALWIEAPPTKYGADNWADLTEIQQQQLLENLYPGAIKEAQKVLDWLDQGQIILTGERGELDYKLYHDLRSEDEQASYWRTK